MLRLIQNQNIIANIGGEHGAKTGERERKTETERERRASRLPRHLQGPQARARRAAARRRAEVVADAAAHRAGADLLVLHVPRRPLRGVDVMSAEAPQVRSEKRRAEDERLDATPERLAPRRRGRRRSREKAPGRRAASARPVRRHARHPRARPARPQAQRPALADRRGAAPRCTSARSSTRCAPCRLERIGTDRLRAALRPAGQRNRAARARQDARRRGARSAPRRGRS